MASGLARKQLAPRLLHALRQTRQEGCSWGRKEGSTQAHPQLPRPSPTPRPQQIAASAPLRGWSACAPLSRSLPPLAARAAQPVHQRRDGPALRPPLLLLPVLHTPRGKRWVVTPGRQLASRGHPGAGCPMAAAAGHRLSSKRARVLRAPEVWLRQEQDKGKACLPVCPQVGPIPNTSQLFLPSRTCLASAAPGLAPPKKSKLQGTGGGAREVLEPL